MIRPTTIPALEEVLFAVHKEKLVLLPALFEPTEADLEYERQLLALEAEIKADLAALWDKPAWENMASTGEGRQKGERWAKQAIWGNVPDDVKRKFGSVEKMTSRDFIQMWEDKVARLGGTDGPSRAADQSDGSNDL